MTKSLRTRSFDEVDRIVQQDACVVVGTNRYSLHSSMIGKKGRIRLYPEHLEIWMKGVLIARYPYCAGENKIQIFAKHEHLVKKKSN